MKSDLFDLRPLSARLISRPSRRMAGWLLVASAAVSSLAAAEGAPKEQAADASPVVAVVRAPAPKVLSEKILAVAREIQPGPQTEALPFILGGMLGDPMLQSISATENIGLVLVAHQGELAPVVVMKLTEESPLRNSLSAFDMNLRDFEGWTFALPANVSSKSVEGNEDALLAAVRETRRYDVELMATGPELSERAGDVFSSLPDAAGMVFVRPIVEAVIAEMEAVPDFRAGLNLSREKIEQVYYLRAAEGSAMAAFLNQERSEDFGFAKYLPADEAVAFLGGFDVQATQRYFDHFIARLNREANDEAGRVWQRIHELGTRYLSSTNGASAGVMSLEGMEVRLATVAPTSLTDEELIQMLGETTAAMEDLIRLQEDGIEQTHEFTANAFTVGGVPVHLVRTESRMPEMPEQRQDMHYALVEGFLLNTSDLGRMAALIQAVRKGEPVEQNLAELIALESDVLAKFRVDLIRYFAGAMQPFMPPEVARQMQALQERNLPPVLGSVSARGGEGELKIAVPVPTLAAAFQALAGLQHQFQQPPRNEP